jgi:hypothetical protein
MRPSNMKVKSRKVKESHIYPSEVALSSLGEDVGDLVIPSFLWYCIPIGEALRYETFIQ